MSGHSRIVKLHSNLIYPPQTLIRRRSCLIIAAMFLIVPFMVLVLIVRPELSTEQMLSQRLAEANVRLQFLESMYHARQEDIAVLSQLLGMTLQNSTSLSLNLNTSIDVLSKNNIAVTTTRWQTLTSLLDALSPETRILLRNVTQALNANLTTAANVRLPTIFHFLPHLLDDPSSLKPAFMLSKGRTGVSIVLGVPTVRREKQSYLITTLHNLISNMDQQELVDTLIIVYIGEDDMHWVKSIVRQIELSLKAYLDVGLIDVIAPSPTYYPNFSRLHITLDDSLERVKWRSKQNLDFAYLMAYAQTKGTFYVQLEDDILTKHNFISIMKKYAISKSTSTKIDQASWILLKFCQLGFIGKMFRSVELPYLITFFHMFYNDKPVDWLLENYVKTRVCRSDKDQKHCNQEMNKYCIGYKPSLFQHIGTSSSLKGKVQKLKDKQFGFKIPAFYPHKDNPPAVAKTNIAPYKNFQLQRAYRGETYFWGLLPQPGDLVEFMFPRPVRLARYLFRSGNSENPSDCFYNTTVEILPALATTFADNTTQWNDYNVTNDGYVIVGKFDAIGLAEGNIDSMKIGAIEEIRLHVHSDSGNWAMLSEIYLQLANNKTNNNNNNNTNNNNNNNNNKTNNNTNNNNTNTINKTNNNTNNNKTNNNNANNKSKNKNNNNTNNTNNTNNNNNNNITHNDPNGERTNEKNNGRTKEHNSS